MNTCSQRAASFYFVFAIFWCSSFKFWCDLTSVCTFMVCICHVCCVFFNKFLPHLSWVYSLNFFPAGFKVFPFKLSVVLEFIFVYSMWQVPNFSFLVSFFPTLDHCCPGVIYWESIFPPLWYKVASLSHSKLSHIRRVYLWAHFFLFLYSICVSLYSYRIRLITIAM